MALEPGGSIVVAAGGVLTRQGRDAGEVAVVHRPEYDEWSLPKGKLEGDEAPLDAALREVREETGFDVRIKSLIGATVYPIRTHTKVVLFWEMEVVGGDGVPTDKEVDEVEWLSVEDVMTRLAHKEERDLVSRYADKRGAAWKAIPRAPAVAESRRKRGWRGESRAALSAYLAQTEISLECAPANGDWSVEARRYLEVARRRFEPRSTAEEPITTHESWGLVLAARRKLVHGMSQSQRQMESVALREEALQKLRGWRRKAVLGLLTKDASAADAERLERALQIRDEHTQNAYRDVAAFRKRLAFMATITLVGAATIVAAWGISPPDLGTSPNLTRWPLPFFVAAFGFLSGSISAFIPLKEEGEMFFTQGLMRWLLILVRPLVGAAAALCAYPLVLSGLIPLEASGAAVLAFSVAAGFSERFLISAIESLRRKEEPPPKS